VNHSGSQRDECVKRQDREKQKKRGRYFQRLELAPEIIRRNGRISRLNLAREIDKEIETTPWTIDKMKKDILAENRDLRWNGHASVYYVDTTLDNYITDKQERLEKSFSLSFSERKEMR